MKIKYKRKETHFKYLLLGVLFFSGLSVTAQISGGEVKPKKEKKEKKKEAKAKEDEYQRTLPPFDYENLTGSTYYISVLGQYSYRDFQDNSVYSFHAKKLDEKSWYAPGITLGTVMELGGNFGLEAGLSFFGHGEQYFYEDPNSDSTYFYSNMYVQAGIPLKLRYTYGQDFQVFGFAGIMPLNILNIRNRTDFRTAEGIETEEVFQKIKQGFNPFNIMVSGGLGLNYYVKYFGLTLNVEYRRHLGNTYSGDTFKRVHHMYGIGVNLGLTYRI